MKRSNTWSMAVIAALAVSLGGASTAMAQAASESYSYDALGRLTRVVYSNGTTISYSYDAAGVPRQHL